MARRRRRGLTSQRSMVPSGQRGSGTAHGAASLSQALSLNERAHIRCSAYERIRVMLRKCDLPHRSAPICATGSLVLCSPTGSRLVPAHNSVCAENIGVLRRPFYLGRHVYNPVRDSFSGLLPVSTSGLSGTGGAGSQTSGRRSPSAAARPDVALSRRPLAVGMALPSLVAMPEGHGAGQAGNRASVASARIPQVLALALNLTPRWAARRESKDL